MKDRVGLRYGRLVVIKYAGYSLNESAVWECLCDCGNIKICRGISLTVGDTKSCGCLHHEWAGKYGERRKKHGHTKERKHSPTYSSWAAMIERCTNIKYAHFDRYGGRGIKVCKRWLKFENFLEDMGERPTKHTLDRINSDKNYTKKNCRWSTQKEQCNNKNNNITITYAGVIYTLAEASIKFDISHKTLYMRKKRGFSDNRCIEQPLKVRSK